MSEVCSCCNGAILLASNGCHNIYYNQKNKAIYYKSNNNFIKLHTPIQKSINKCNIIDTTIQDPINNNCITDTCNSTEISYNFIGIYNVLPSETYQTVTICVIINNSADPKIYIYIPGGMCVDNFINNEWNLLSNLYYNCDNCELDICVGYIEQTLTTFINNKLNQFNNMKYCYKYLSNAYKKLLRRNGEYLVKYNVQLQIKSSDCIEINIGQVVQNDIYVALLKYNTCTSQNEIMCISTRKVIMKPIATNVTHEFMHYLDIRDKILVVVFYNTENIEVVESNIKLTFLKQC